MSAVRRLESVVLDMYPLAFRRRYGEEMRSLLDEQPPRFIALLDLLRGALVAHLRPPEGLRSSVDVGDRLRLSVAGVLGCWVAFAAAGFGFYETTEDQPFPAAGAAHPLLGGAHVAVQAIAVLASAAVLLGALPLILCALTRARAERDRLRLLVTVPPATAVLFCGLTALIVLLAHRANQGSGLSPVSAAASVSGSRSGSPFDDGVFIAWGLAALACGAVIVAASRMALFATPVPRRRLTAALASATVVTAGMVLIALATGVYTVALQIDAPHLAASLTGPLQISPTLVALLVQLAVMVAAGTLALTATARGWHALGLEAPGRGAGIAAD